MSASARPSPVPLVIRGAIYGMVFILIVKQLRRGLVIPAGMVYGLAVFVVSSFIALPVAAKLTGAGSVITDMAKMVGWSTFAVEHLMFGAVLGLLTFALSRSDSTGPTVELRLPVAA